MTRTLTLSFAGALALALSACGGSEEEPRNETQGPAAVETPASESPAPEAAPEPAPQADDAASPAGDTAAAPETPEPTETAGEDAGADDSANVFASLPAPYNTANFDTGKRTFRLCQSCHLIEEGAGNRVGPNLYGMFDRKVGELDGFNYSRALMEADFDWTPEKLEEWLADPRGFLPGNRMSFAGVRRPDDRTAVIAYIMLESGYTAGE